jgi:hypothetical protein
MKLNFTKKLNWKYALGEIILVFIAICLALWLDNWNDLQKDLKYENQALNSLKTEFKQNKENLEKTLERKKRSWKYIDSLMLMCMSNKLPIDYKQKSIKYLNVATIPWTYNPKNGVLNAILASGKLELISKLSTKIISRRFTGNFR